MRLYNNSCLLLTLHQTCIIHCTFATMQFIPSLDEILEDKKALVVSGLKIVLNEQSLRVCPS